MINIGDMLEVSDARIISNVFENGSNISQYWEIRINFNQIKINRLELKCFVSCKNMEIKCREWIKINKLSLDYKSQPDSEWAFYTTEFEYIDFIDGELSYYKNNIFNINLHFKLIIKGLFDEDVYVEKIINCKAEYEGLVVSQKGSSSELRTVNDCLRIIDDIADSKLYHKKPELIYRTSYLFRAKTFL